MADEYEISAKITADDSGFAGAAARVNSAAQSMGDALGKSNETIKKSFSESLNAVSSAAKQVGVALSVGITAPIVLLGKQFLESSGQFQMYQSSFETMLGSAGKATATIKELQVMSAATPFELSDLAGATKTLLQFNVSQEKVMPTLKALGDISQGNGQRFQALALSFGQASASGKLMGQDLMQMINAGFNPLQEISKKTGESIASLKDKMSAGGISAEMLSDAFMSATAEGGKFFGGMDKASRTLPGLLSTLNDDFMTMGRSFSDILMPAAMDLVKQLSGVAKSISEISEPAKNAVISVSLFAAIMGPLALGIAGVTKAMAFFSTAMTAHPIGMVIAAVAVLTAGLIALTAAMKSSAEQKVFKDTTEQLKQAKEEGENVADAVYRIARETGLTTEKVAELARAAGLVTDEIETQVDAVVKASAAEDARKGSLSETLRLNNEIARAAQSTLLATRDGVSENIDIVRLAKNLAENFDVSEQKAIGILLQNKGLTTEQKTQLETLQAQLLELDKQKGKLSEMEVAAKRYRQALPGETAAYIKAQDEIFKQAQAAIKTYNDAVKKTEADKKAADVALIASLKALGRTDFKEYQDAVKREEGRAKFATRETEFSDARTKALKKYDDEIEINLKLLKANQITKEQFLNSEKAATDALVVDLIELSVVYKEMWGSGNAKLLDEYIAKQDKLALGLNVAADAARVQAKFIDDTTKAMLEADAVDRANGEYWAKQKANEIDTLKEFADAEAARSREIETNLEMVDRTRISSFERQKNAQAEFTDFEDAAYQEEARAYLKSVTDRLNAENNWRIFILNERALLEDQAKEQAETDLERQESMSKEYVSLAEWRNAQEMAAAERLAAETLATQERLTAEYSSLAQWRIAQENNYAIVKADLDKKEEAAAIERNLEYANYARVRIEQELAALKASADAQAEIQKTLTWQYTTYARARIDAETDATEKSRQAWGKFRALEARDKDGADKKDADRRKKAFADSVDKWTNYAKQVADIMGGTAGEVVTAVANIGGALAKGDWIGAAVAALSALVKLFTNEYNKALREANRELEKQKKLFTDAGQAANAYTAILAKVKAQVASFYESLQDVGTEIASTLVDNLTSGLTESDFLETMKKYIIKMVIQAAIFTESLSAQIAEIGQAIADGIANGMSADQIANIRAQLASLYQNASATATQASAIVEGGFTNLNTPAGAAPQARATTINFNSPRSLSPYEQRVATTRQMRRMAFEENL